MRLKIKHDWKNQVFVMDKKKVQGSESRQMQITEIKANCV